MTEVYILLRNKNGKKKKDKRVGINIRSNANHTELLAGTLLKLCPIQNDGVEKNFESIDAADIVEVQCNEQEVEKLKNVESDLLRPVPNCFDRLVVYKNKEWLLEGSTLKENDSVFVKIKGHQSELPGRLRYRGPLTDLPGIYFGVELTENKGEGTCDGIYHNRRYFHAPSYSSVFCPLHKIRRRREGWQRSDRARAGQLSSTHTEMTNLGDEPLSIGDRVMWPSDNGPEFGIVCWIGRLPDDPSGDITVGVEFENPIGTGTGKYRDERLFYTKQGHASLVPLMGLVRADSHDNLSTDPEYLRQQEELFQQFQQQTSSSTSSYPVESASQSSLQQRSASKSSYPTSDTTSDHHLAHSGGDMAVAGDGGAAAFSSKGSKPVQVEEGENGMADFMMGLKDTVGGDSGTNPVYLISQYQESCERNARDSKQSSTGSQSSSVTPDPDLVVGSMVEVFMAKTNSHGYGVIRWIGKVDDSLKLTAGLEMEEEINAGTDGTFRGKRLFTCPSKKALFLPLNRCRKDKRFQAEAKDRSSHEGGFGTVETPDITGDDISPPEVNSPEELLAVCGKERGIQGHHNSCYLDATLFSMFYFTTVFDFIFNKPQEPGSASEQVQKVLKEGIVNPLRKGNYVRADKVLRLRGLLDKLGTIPGMMGEEKDPEEFLSALLSEILKADPLLHLSSGEHTYFYQLFIEKDEKLLLPTTQELVELSFLQGNVKLKEVPSCLMLQMPRFGKDYKMYRRIIPSLELDITDILEMGIRECYVCGGLAVCECKDCYSQHGQGLSTTAFCEQCIIMSHQHKKRQGHNHQPLKVPDEFLPHYTQMKHESQGRQNGEQGGPSGIVLPREKMELFAVVCIQTSHYVSFVKCGMGKDAPWVFFDSMADRMGEQGGYNIPEVQHVPELTQWLSENNFQHIQDMEEDRQLPEHMRRLLCDAYMVMYQSPSVMMFR